MDSVNKWLTLLANFGVIAGIILLALELNQNTASIKGSAYQTWVAANLELNIAASQDNMSETIRAGILDSENLTQENFIEFALWNYSLFQLIQATDYLYKTGSLDRDLWESEINRGAVHLELPGVREWWDAGGKTQLTPEFVQLIESTHSTSTRWSWEEGTGFIQDQ